MRATAQKQESASKKGKSLPSFVELPAGYTLIMVKPTTPAKRKAAAKYLLDNMPPPVKKGEKGAAQLVAEYRRS